MYSLEEDPYFRGMYKRFMDPLREEAARLKTKTKKGYMGRGFAGSSAWERQLRGVDTALLRTGGDVMERLALDIGEKRRAEEQARKQGWGRLIGTGLGMAASFIPGMQPFAPALVAGGGQVGGMMTGGAGDKETMQMMQDPEFLAYLQYLRKLYGIEPEQTGGQGFFGKYGQKP